MNTAYKKRNKNLEYVLIFLYFFSIHSFIEFNRVLYWVIQVSVFCYFSFILLFYNRNLKIYNFSLWYLLFLLIVLTNSLINGVENSIPFMKGVLQLFIFSLVLIPFMINDDTALDTAYLGIVLGSVVFSIYLLINTPISLWGVVRLGNYQKISHPIFVAASVSTGFAFSIYLYTVKQKKILLVFGVFQIFIVLLTGSRKYLIVIFLMLLFLFIYKDLGRSRRFTISLILKFVIVSGAFASFGFILLTNQFLYNIIGNRIEGFFNLFSGEPSSIDSSTLARIEIIKRTFEIFKMNPIFGIGFGNYSNYIGTSHPHNNYLDLLTGLGVIGFCCYYLFIILLLKNLIYTRYRNLKLHIFYILLIVSILLMDLFATSYNLEFYFYCYLFAFCVFNKESSVREFHAI